MLHALPLVFMNRLFGVHCAICVHWMELFGCLRLRCLRLKNGERFYPWKHSMRSRTNVWPPLLTACQKKRETNFKDARVRCTLYATPHRYASAIVLTVDIRLCLHGLWIDMKVHGVRMDFIEYIRHLINQLKNLKDKCIHSQFHLFLLARNHFNCFRFFRLVSLRSYTQLFKLLF